jgi:hypothetical protein
VNCYVCGNYSYKSVRHDTCEPRYRRSRFHECARCGKPSRGLMHKRCRHPNAGGGCGYCGEPTSGSYCNTCQPIGLNALAVFADMPGVVQRRCTKCREWYPFAAIDGEEAGTHEAWAPRGRDTRSGKPRMETACRACIAARRRGDTVGSQQGARTPDPVRLRMVSLRSQGETFERIAVETGYSVRTVIRVITQERRAA